MAQKYTQPPHGRRERNLKVGKKCRGGWKHSFSEKNHGLWGARVRQRGRDVSQERMGPCKKKKTETKIARGLCDSRKQAENTTTAGTQMEKNLKKKQQCLQKKKKGKVQGVTSNERKDPGLLAANHNLTVQGVKLRRDNVLKPPMKKKVP